MTSNSKNFLKTAADMFKGSLGDAEAQLKAARETKGGVLFDIVVNLVCHAAVNVFGDGYTKKGARQFKDDVVTEFGISEKQAGKYTESVSAALGVRGLRNGVKPIEGLDVAAADGPKTVVELLKAKEIVSFASFMAATRATINPLLELAKKTQKLNSTQRAKLAELVAKLDEENAPEVDENDGQTDSE